MVCVSNTRAQERNVLGGLQGNLGRFGNTSRQFVNNGSNNIDSLGHRNKFEDSLTISYHYLDSTRWQKLDSSVNDFYRRYPLPANHINLGNIGTASRSLLFDPENQAGFDPGFHAFDVYKWKLEKVRFFNTTRPYSEINYLLASRVEQIIEILHTQNIKPSWNFMFNYRLINSPGIFKNQKTNHNNYLITSTYESFSRRYNIYIVLLGNTLESSENGGIKNDQDYLNNKVYKDRFNIPTNIGGDAAFGANFLSTNIPTGNKYREFTALLRQQFDFGKKDSIVTDSTVIPLFYPRLRLEHTIQYSINKYVFEDVVGDSVYYKTNYDTALRYPTDTLKLKDRWKELSNDFSIYQFPDAKNVLQFIKLGLTIQNLSGEFISGKHSFFNTFGHAEYRNKTRDRKWDIEASGKLFFTGYNSGDYRAYISLQRFAGKKQGYLQVGFENSSRTPSFIFDQRSSFYLLKTDKDFKKENQSHIFASLFVPGLKLRLGGDYYLISNYTYLTEYYKLQQEATLFNVIRISAEKTFALTKHLIWHADLYFQHVIGDAPVHLPTIYFRNRIGYEGNLGFKNLNMAAGFEIRYRSAYKADNYSPVLGRFFYQDSVSIRNPLPDISAYVHFRIRPFKAFFRVENLNTARNLDGNFGFTHNNLVAPGYAYPGLVLRLGIYWSFVN